MTRIIKKTLLGAKDTSLKLEQIYTTIYKIDKQQGPTV